MKVKVTNICHKTKEVSFTSIGEPSFAFSSVLEKAVLNKLSIGDVFKLKNITNFKTNSLPISNDIVSISCSFKSGDMKNND